MRGASSGKLKLSPEHMQLLKDADITESGPGTIIADFNMLLRLIGNRGFPLTGTHQLPMRALPEINARLAHPLEQKLKRPQQKSYPPICGLYLLLRASGLTFTGGTCKKPLLFVDQDLHKAWKRLNPSEQYFTLFETWLLRANPEIIGEPGSRFSVPDHFREWKLFFDETPKGGRKIADNRDAEDLLRYSPGWHNLGLLQLFGLISVQEGLPVEGKAWNIEHIYRAPFGDALLSLLVSRSFGSIENILQLKDKLGSAGVLQPLLQPYFPEWINNLPIPQWTFREGTYIFKVSWGKVWYRIAIPAALSLDTLATAILNAVRFSNDHLYQFSYRNRFGALERVRHPFLKEGPWTSDVSVGDLPLGISQTMIFLFDFGDEWQFDVTLERIDSNMPAEKAVLLETHGEPPRQYGR